MAVTLLLDVILPLKYVTTMTLALSILAMLTLPMVVYIPLWTAMTIILALLTAVLMDNVSINQSLVTMETLALIIHVIHNL